MRSVNLSIDSADGDTQIDYTGGQVRRLSLTESTGSASCSLAIWDGSGTSGQVIDTITISAGESTRDNYRCHEYPFHGGLFVQVLSGAFTGVVVVQHKDDGEEWGEPVVIVGSVTNVFST